jgi:RimJ/RimL family protein N-acetyltransferase
MLRSPSSSLNWRQFLLPGLKEAQDSWRLANGTAVRIRTVKPDDGALLQELVGSLSLNSRYRRFFYPIRELTPDLLARFTQSDPAGSMTLLAVVYDKGREVAIGMAQCVAEPYPEVGEFAVVVADAWHRAGIATRLLRRLICTARTAGIERLEGDVLSENEPMLRLLMGMGFEFGPHPDGAYLTRAHRGLVSAAWKCSAMPGLVARTTPAFNPV